MFQAHHIGLQQHSYRSPKLGIGKDLENLLICFALKHGAVQAHVDQAKQRAYLVSTTQSGTVVRTDLTGSACEWYAALKSIDFDVEDDRAGLLRFLQSRSEHQNIRTPIGTYHHVSGASARRRQPTANSTIQTAAHVSLGLLTSKHSSPRAARA